MGGVGGHFGYMASAVASGTYNRNAHLAAIGGSAILGAFSPVNGARSLVNGMRNTAIGVGVGGATGYVGSIGTNNNIR